MKYLVLIASLLPTTLHAQMIDSFIDRSKLFFGSKSGASSECTAPPTIRSSIELKDPVLSDEKPAQKNLLRPSHGVMQGLANLDYGFNVDFLIERIRTGENYCVRISEVTIHAGQKAPLIWLNPAIRNRPCQREVTIAHELEHVKVYHDHLWRFESAIENEMPLLVQGRSYEIVTGMLDAVSAEAVLQESFMEVLDDLHGRSYAIALQEDSALDSPEEYRRLAGLCN